MNATDINQTFDLLALAEGDTSLRRTGNYYIGPCPMPGCQADTDGFVLKHTPEGWRWYCRKCGEGKYHTSLDYIMQHEGLEFKAALASLGGDSSRLLPQLAPRQPRLVEPPFPSPEWQAKAWQVQTKAITNLIHSPHGEKGRQYLEGRGLTLAMWEIASLGVTHVYDPQAEIKRPAITIPHFDHPEAITGVKVRFVDDHPQGQRYTARPGSKFYLYGLFEITGAADTLLILEGEINALSVMQCRPARVNTLSIGSDNFTEAQAALLKPLATCHRRVMIWTDEPAKSEKVKTAIAKVEAERLKSPMIDGRKHDANELLQAGILSDFISTILNVECLGIVPQKPARNP